MNKIKRLIGLISELIETDTINYYYEVKLGQKQTGKEFTDSVRVARESNDRRTKIMNDIEQSLVDILKDYKYTIGDGTYPTGEIAESLSFLIDVFVINHLKVWFSEQEIRELNQLESPDPERMKDLVNYSRQANDNRIRLRELIERKLIGILTGIEGVGSKEPKLFNANKRN